MSHHRHLLLSLLLVLLAASCSKTPQGAAPTSLVDDAARQATAIVEQAQATALVRQAQAQATAIAAQAATLVNTPTPVPTVFYSVENDEEAQDADDMTSTTEADDRMAPTPWQTVEIVSVGLAGEGGFVIVQFRAPPAEVDGWWQGDLYVVDEETDAVYEEIPVMPKIGPLIGRPQLDGQVGYVMLVNAPPGLRPGARVTVVLDEYRFEHVVVQ